MLPRAGFGSNRTRLLNQILSGSKCTNFVIKLLPGPICTQFVAAANLQVALRSLILVEGPDGVNRISVAVPSSSLTIGSSADVSGYEF